MKKIGALILTLAVSSSLFMGCSQLTSKSTTTKTVEQVIEDSKKKDKAVEDKDKAEILSVINKNAMAMEKANVDEYMGSISDRDKDLFDRTKTDIATTFSKYKFENVDVSNINFTQYDGVRAKVTVTQISAVTPVGKTETKEIKQNIEHTLYKEDGLWKMTKSETLP